MTKSARTFSTIQVVKLSEGCYVFVGLSYSRLRDWLTNKDKGPSLTVRTQLCATVEEVLEHWHKSYYSTPSNTPHETVRVSLEIEGPTVRLSDPWLLYHMGALTEMTRANQELAQIGNESQVTKAVVGALEALTTARIKQLTDVVGRR